MKQAIAVTLLVAAMSVATASAFQGNITIPTCVFQYTDANGVLYNYDFSSLILKRGDDYRGFDPNNAYQYYLNVCGSVSCTAATPVAGVCQMRLVNGAWVAYHSLGDYSGATWDLIDPNTPSAGIYFSLYDGDNCPGGGPRQSDIYFDCDSNANDPQDVNMTVVAVGCVYDFHIATAFACGTQPQPPPPPPGNPSSGLSGGSVFLIIFFVFGFVYVAGGCIFRRVSYGVSGTEACPNHEFWTALPGLVSDGWRFTVSLICRGQAGGNSSYENVK